MARKRRKSIFKRLTDFIKNIFGFGKRANNYPEDYQDAPKEDISKMIDDIANESNHGSEGLTSNVAVATKEPEKIEPEQSIIEELEQGK